jgi:hypothetical protein
MLVSGHTTPFITYDTAAVGKICPRISFNLTDYS